MSKFNRMYIEVLAFIAGLVLMVGAMLAFAVLVEVGAHFIVWLSGFAEVRKVFELVAKFSYVIVGATIGSTVGMYAQKAAKDALQKRGARNA